MKKYNVTVNGKTYEVEVEELVADKAVSTAMPVSEVPQPLKVEPPVLKQQSDTAKDYEANAIKAPMQGVITRFEVQIGDDVKKGQTLCVLEAMKMENEINAYKDGKVTAIHTSKGAAVKTNDPLISIE